MNANDQVLDAESYYRASANPTEPFGRFDGEIRADVCIVGAGFTGLSAALELARANYTVIVLEAGSVAWGASGRNGGHVCTGYSPGMGKFEKQLGFDTAKKCFDVAEEAKDLLRERVEEYTIDCDLKWGYLLAAPKASQTKHLESYRDELARYGYSEISLLSKDELEGQLGSTIYHGATRDKGAGHLHPLNYALGLADAVRSEGGTVYENSRVTRIEPGAPALVQTERGKVLADHVVVACNAYINNLLPGPHSRVMPVGSYMIATQPLGENQARALIKGDEAVSDMGYVLDYFRLSADHRVLFGGRCSYSGIHPRDLASNMRPRLTRVFPQLKEAAIDYAWGGYIGITYNRLPNIGRAGQNVYYAQGYSGQGVVLTGIFGKLMAEAIRGQVERFDVFAKIRHAPFPGGPLRRPALAMGMLYYRLKDLLA